MQLYLLRHGLAADAGPEGTGDAGRPLTKDGAAKMQQAAQGLRRLDLGVEALITSPLVRAHQTAEIVAHELKLDLSLSDLLRPGCGLGQLLALLGEQGSARRVMIVGHEPDFGNIIGALIGGEPVPLKKGGLARVDMEAPSAGRGTLVWLLAPRVLQALGH
jgi:phosphohistidine phosphatase